jgi:asparagine synthase (glutamine-hydrolysing)
LAATSRRLFDDDTLRTLGFDARRAGLTPQFLPPEACEAFVPPTGDTFATVSRAELSLYMGNTLLRDSDVNSMAHSLELRVPFIGQNLVDYVARLPGPVRAPPGTAPKHLLRRVMQEQLPAGVFTRPKSGFSLPFAAWMAGPLRDQCATAIDALADCPAFDSRTIRDRWAGLMARPDQVHWSRPLSLVVLGNYLAAARRHQNG